MKYLNTPLCIAVCAVISHTAMAQLPAGFVNAKQVYYYGMEFSEVRCFGDGFANSQDVRDRYFKDMNTYVWDNGDQYNLPNCIKNKKLVYHIEEVMKHIDSIDHKNMVRYSATDQRHINEDLVDEIVGRFKKTDTEAYGFVIIVEDMNKLEMYGSYWYTLFNTQTGEVIFTKRYEDEPRGLGLKRFWLDPIQDINPKFKKDIGKML